MRQPVFPKRKSKLSPHGKAVAAASVLLAISEGAMDDKQAGAFLRDRIGLNWSLLTAIQYLTGQEAITALEALPLDWSEGGLEKKHMIAAVVVAHDMAANLHPTSPLSAGLAVKKFKRTAGE